MVLPSGPRAHAGEERSNRELHRHRGGQQAGLRERLEGDEDMIWDEQGVLVLSEKDGQPRKARDHCKISARPPNMPLAPSLAKWSARSFVKCPA